MPMLTDDYSVEKLMVPCQ